MASNAKKEPRREKRLLESLRPFPRQEEFFGDLRDAELRALANDIEANGLKVSIEILPENSAGIPENTILSGHQRRRALLSNGQTEVEVVVRYDLAEEGLPAVERRFLQQNMSRRHLSKLDQARVARRLYEIGIGRSPGTLDVIERVDARDRVGEILNVSGRNLQRYWNVLDAPREVQLAFERGELSLVRADKVAGFPAATQEDIAARIKAGEAAKQLVEGYVRTTRRPPSKRAAVSQLKRSLQRAVNDLGGHVDEIGGGADEDELAVLRVGVKLIEEVVLRLEANNKSFDDAIREFGNDPEDAKEEEDVAADFRS